MSETTTKSTAEKAKAAGAKSPADKKKAASAQLKALQAEAAAGDVVVELHGEFLTVHVEAYQKKTVDDYEFMEISMKGILPAMLDVLLDAKDREKLKSIARDEETNLVSTERMAELFSELMEAAGQGN